MDLRQEIETFLNKRSTDHYEIAYPLDGNKRVYLAKLNGNTYRVIKVVDKHMLSPTYIETLLNLDLPGISKIYFIESFQDFYIVVKEYVEGVTLYEYIEEKGVLSEDECIRISKGLINSLDYLHNSKSHLIYRDIQPKNIIIDDNREAILIDTESIRMYDESKNQDTVMIGTAGFIAPEQFGYNQSSVQSDIFSLGALMYYSLTSKTLTADASKNMTKNKEVSKRLSKVILKMSRFSPSERYKNFTEIKSELKKIERIKKLPSVWILTNLFIMTLVIIASIAMNVYQYNQSQTLENQIFNKSRDIIQLQSDLDEYKSSLEAEQDNLTKSEETSTNLQKTVEDLTAQIQDLQDQLIELQKAYDMEVASNDKTKETTDIPETVDDIPKTPIDEEPTDDEPNPEETIDDTTEPIDDTPETPVDDVYSN